MSVKWWNENKMWLAPVAAGIMWAVSVLCFVFGLSFKNPMGVMVANTDVSIFIAFALSIANTIIQLIGNGQDFEKMDGVFRVGWYSSYVLGIASNVNALLGILGISNVFLEWAVALSLGSMIEIMPEKLIVVWLKSIPAKSVQMQQKQDNNQKSKYVPQNKPAHMMNTQNLQRAHQNLPVPHSTPKPYPRPSGYLQTIQEMESDGELIG